MSYRDEEDPRVMQTIEIGLLLFISGVLIGEMIDDSKVNKAKEEFNKIVAQDMNYSSVDVKYFDWYSSDDNEYLFKFTGSALNSYNEEIDFFACSYEVSEKQYYEMLDYINDIKEKDARELDSHGLLDKLIEIVKEAEISQRKEVSNVVTEENKNVILNVSKAKIEGDKVYYNVSYATPYRNEDGTLGIRTTITKVSYDLNENLAKNPTGVFLLSKDRAHVEVLKSENKNIGMFNPVEFNKVSANRRKI